MRILTIILSLLLFSCSHEPYNSYLSIKGKWELIMDPEGESRVAYLDFNPEGTGHLILPAQPTSFLLPSSDEFSFHWEINNEEFIITRSDNNFKLKYEILKWQGASAILLFENEIRVNLVPLMRD